MKKFFLLFSALVAFTAANATTEDDLQVCKHSKVFVMDDYTGNGTGSRTKDGLVFSGYFWDVNGGSVATNKGSVDLAKLGTTDKETGDFIGYELVGCEASDTVGWGAKYGKYGSHLNSLRIKNKQDVFAIKVTQGTKVFFVGKSGGSGVRYPGVAKDKELKELYTSDAATTAGPWIFCYKATDDQTLYVGSVGGDTYLSYVIVEANEADGTPSVEVSDMQYDGSLYYKTVTCEPAEYGMKSFGFSLGTTTVYYTTDGTEPTNESTQYTEPIKCYANQTVKFQAYFEKEKLTAADNEGVVEFSFDAPTLDVNDNDKSFTITSTYNNAQNYYTLNGGEAVPSNGTTLTESATVEAYTVITNGSYATFTSLTKSEDIFVLSPIKETKTLTVTGDVVTDEEATAAAADGSTVYKVENGATSVDNDKDYFFVKSTEFGAVKEAKYQVPEGQEAYLKMTSNTSITFKVAEGDTVRVTVTCSKNSYKNDENLACKVKVSGTEYGNDDITAENGNIITFDLGGGTYTFEKYSGTGNIYVSSIVFECIVNGINEVSATATSVNAPAYNLAGQRVSDSFKGIQIKNGKKFIVK